MKIDLSCGEIKYLISAIGFDLNMNDEQYSCGVEMVIDLKEKLEKTLEAKK